MVIDRRVYGAIEQRSRELDVHLVSDHGMWIARVEAILRQANHHRHAPGIGAEQPVDRRLLVFTKLIVASHLAIQVRLGRERGHQIVRAPDEWNPNPKSVVGSSGYSGQSLLIVVGDNLAIAAFGETPYLIVTVVVPRIPLIVPGGVRAHPRCNGLSAGILECVAEVFAVSRQSVQLRCAELHVVEDRKSTRLNSSHSSISYAVFCLKKKR